jgi:uncharacterized protein (TIGR02147 family)
MAQMFELTDYKKYLNAAIDELSENGRGIRLKFAKAMDCQPGYVSQVLNGSAHLSLEHADKASRFLGHTDDESQYFLSLVLFARAGTTEFKERMQRQIDLLQAEHLNLKKRFKIKDRISEKDQSVFYSNWQYVAVLTALSVPALQSKEAISARFHIPLKRVSEIIEYLVSAQLIKIEKGKFLPTTTRTHLGANSPLISKHHINWRLQAIQSLEKESATDLHYSSVISLSKGDMKIIKMKISEGLDEIKKIIRDSKDETICSFAIDFFEL